MYKITVYVYSTEVPVDVFYEIPLHPTSERYVYQIVPCPMDTVYQHSFPRGQFISTMNWQGIIQQYMGSGWKLVEIFEDYSTSSRMQAHGFTTNISMQKNCLWIFEKPVSRLDDNTPYYEGTMVEHWFKTDTEVHGLGFGGVSMNVKTDWEPIIEHMGKYGWQVVRILSTPDSHYHGSFKITVMTRQLIFFQRRLRDDSGQGINLGLQQQPVSNGDPSPPGYDQLYPPVEGKH